MKRGLRAKKLIRKVVSNSLVPLSQVWAHFMPISENKADLAAFLSEDLVKRFPNVPAGCEFVLGGGFVCTEKISSSSREKVLALTCDHGDADISLWHASAAKLIKSAHLPAAAMLKIVVTRHHELSSIVMDHFFRDVYFSILF